MSAIEILAEVAEETASGETAQIYEELRCSMAVPVVALFYRNLAAIEGALPWMWRIVRPLAKSEHLEAAASRIAAVASVAPLDRLALPASIDEIQAIIDAYNRGNPFNITCAALLNVVLDEKQTVDDVTEPPRAVALPTAPEALPRLVALTDIPPNLRAAITKLETADTKGDGIVPSLYRHLAHWPDFLEQAANALMPHFDNGQILAAARAVAKQSRIEAMALEADTVVPPMPPGLVQARDRIVASVDRFSHRIPEMIVVGQLLSEALNKRK